MIMLLFVRNPYYRDILEGRKCYELRAGARYRNIKAGDHLSINGKLRVEVERAEQCSDIGTAALASGLSTEHIRACYPDAIGPFYLFHFASQTPHHSA